MVNLNELAKQIHTKQVEKGFYEKPREIGTLLMLIVSELAEALEADRKNKHSPNIDYLTDSWCAENKVIFKESFELAVKDTFEDEIADAMIRLFDLVGNLNIDIEKHIELKLKYNDTRPYKHNKEY